MTTEFQDRLIQIALRKEYLTPEQVQAALERLARVPADGSHVRLHRLLLETGALTRDQLVDVRRTMAREGVHPRVADFYVLSRIGRGTTGTVYRAHDRKLDRAVALKLLASHLAADPKYVERFLREARLAARINHPNVVQVFDVGQWRGTHYIVMEHVEGRSLERIISDDGPLDEPAAVRTALGVAEALRAAATKGVVHRDIKPGNVLIRKDGTVKLADLGLAVAAGEAGEDGVGTPYYMSPEQARNASDIDTRSDIYSLGCTLYHAVTGRPPFKGTSAYETLRLHVEASRPNPRALRPDISPAFAAALRRMTAIRPRDRFQSPDELSEALEPLLSPRSQRRSERLLWMLGILAAVIALVLILLTCVALFGGPAPGGDLPLDRTPAAPERWDGPEF
jgi:serine/threonine-protein kinase